MAFLSTSVRLVRTTHLIPPIPAATRTHQPPTRYITTGRPRIPSFSPPPPARRNFEYLPLRPPKPDRDPPTPASTSEIPRRPTNDQIPFKHVYVLDPDTNKLSQTTHRLESLLATRERKVVELVASSPKPIVRVTTRSEVEARYREMRRALKKAARVGEEHKEVHLTWGVERADLEHKIRKARRDLEKGYRVVVVVAIKNWHRPSSRQELVAFADEISTALGEVGEEWKEREISARSMTLSFRKTKLGENAPGSG